MQTSARPIYHATCQIVSISTKNSQLTLTSLFCFAIYEKLGRVFRRVCTPGIPVYLPPSMYHESTWGPYPDYVPWEYPDTCLRVYTLEVPGYLPPRKYPGNTRVPTPEYYILGVPGYLPPSIYSGSTRVPTPECIP